MTERTTASGIGDRMTDGTVYVGVSPESVKKIYAMPADVPIACTFDGAREYADIANAKGMDTRLRQYGHNDWRVPAKNELNVLFNNRATIGGFDIRGQVGSGWYWSSSSGDKWMKYESRRFRR